MALQWIEISTSRHMQTLAADVPGGVILHVITYGYCGAPIASSLCVLNNAALGPGGILTEQV